MIHATLHIDPARRIGPVNPNIYGQFIEHLGACIYDGIYEPGSPLTDARGFRGDVLDATRALRVPVVRWPGGNFVSGYHWQDGVGDVSTRPVRWDAAWGKTEPNSFGTGEFIEWCRAAGTDPYLCFNMGTGTLDEAMGWLEYCNGGGETAWSRLRIDHGHEAAYGVKYWGLGNEVYGPWQIGYKSASQYAEQAREYAKVARRVDRTIELIACGAGEAEWDWEVLRTAGPFINYISLHDYFGPEPGGDPYYSLVARGHTGQRYIRDLWGLIEAARHRYGIKRSIHICVDEWNVFYRRTDFRQFGTMHEERYDLADALCVATYLNSLIRNANAVTMANMAQLVNVIAPIVTSRDGMLLQSIYYPLLVHAQHRGGVALDVWTESETFDARGGAVPYVDIAVTYDDASRRAYVHAVNLHREQTASLAIRAADGISPSDIPVWVINGPSVDAANTFEDSNRVRVLEHTLAAGSPIELPPHSASTFVLQVR